MVQFMRVLYRYDRFVRLLFKMSNNRYYNIPFSEAYLAITAFISSVAFKYGTRLLPLPKTSVTSLLAFSIAEGASVLLNSLDLEEPLHPIFI